MHNMFCCSGSSPDSVLNLCKYNCVHTRKFNTLADLRIFKCSFHRALQLELIDPVGDRCCHELIP